MSIFLSKYINKVDKKGRVSVPAPYRSILSNEDFNGVVIYPSFKNNCIEACSMSRLKEISQFIENLDPYSEERDAFETIVLGQSVQLSFDNEGRIILPTNLMDQVDISSSACFIGKGLVFEIWNPDLLENHLKISREIAQNNRFVLKNNTKNNLS